MYVTSAVEWKMAGVRNEWTLFLAVSSVCVLLILVDSDGRSLLQLVGRALLCLGFISALIYVLERWRTRRTVKVTHKSDPAAAANDNDDDERIHQQLQEARLKVQQHYDQKAADYNERILEPRERAKQEKAEKDFYQFSGPAWKGRGQKLGTETESFAEISSGGTGRDAAKARKLPEHIENPPTPPQKPKPARRKVVLPEEPPEGTVGGVMVAIRTPQGTVHKRRFLVSHKVQVLLDYMTKVGYHQNLYTLAKSYPRASLDTQVDQTLEQQGITKDMALNVEYREEDP